MTDFRTPTIDETKAIIFMNSMFDFWVDMPDENIKEAPIGFWIDGKFIPYLWNMAPATGRWT